MELNRDNTRLNYDQQQQAGENNQAYNRLAFSQQHFDVRMKRHPELQPYVPSDRFSSLAINRTSTTTATPRPQFAAFNARAAKSNNVPSRHKSVFSTSASSATSNNKSINSDTSVSSSASKPKKYVSMPRLDQLARPKRVAARNYVKQPNPPPSLPPSSLTSSNTTSTTTSDHDGTPKHVVEDNFEVNQKHQNHTDEAKQSPSEQREEQFEEDEDRELQLKLEKELEEQEQRRLLEEDEARMKKEIREREEKRLKEKEMKEQEERARIENELREREERERLEREKRESIVNDILSRVGGYQEK